MPLARSSQLFASSKALLALSQWRAPEVCAKMPSVVTIRRESIQRDNEIRYPGFGTLFLCWTMVGAVSWARYAIEAQDPRAYTASEFLGWLTCYYPWLLFTPLLFRVERRFQLAGEQWKKGIPVLVAASLPLSWLAYVLTSLFDAPVRAAFHLSPAIPPRWWLIPTRELLLEEVLYWAAVGASCAIRVLLELREKERLAAQLALEKSALESSLRKSELEVLRMRLNPHFLFNSLQNISILTRRDPNTASRMLTQLGDLLRASLQNGAQAHTTLAAEVGLTRAYVAVEQMRFADRLSVLFEVEPEVELTMVPNFLLQPLVENAITHGLRGAQQGVIWIRGLHQGQNLVLTVSDNGSGLPSESLAELQMGVGLGSTCERLVRMYPGRHEFSIQTLPEGGTEVRIVLPLVREGAASKGPTHDLASSTDRR
jgi:two-component system, LytTR family, sensor kinase